MKQNGTSGLHQVYAETYAGRYRTYDESHGGQLVLQWSVARLVDQVRLDLPPLGGEPYPCGGGGSGEGGEDIG